MLLFDVDNSLSTWVGGISVNLISNLLWFLGGMGITFLLQDLIYRIPLLAMSREYWLRLFKIKYPDLRGYWVNQNKYYSKEFQTTYDLMIVRQVGKSWQGRTIVSNETGKEIYYDSKAEIVKNNYLIGTWEKTDPSSKKPCGAFQVIITNSCIMNGKSLSQSVFPKTTNLGSNWISVKVNVSFYQRLVLLLGRKVCKKGVLENLLNKRDGNRNLSLRDYIENERREDDEKENKERIRYIKQFTDLLQIQEENIDESQFTDLLQKQEENINEPSNPDEQEF